MKRISTALFVLACLAGIAAASTGVTSYAKVQRLANSELCYLDVAVNENYASLVKSELQRRKVSCTPALRAKGQRVIERRARLADEQATIFEKTGGDRERQETNRLAYCAQFRGQEPGCTTPY